MYSSVVKYFDIYFLVAIIFFFFNSLFLPQGLLYTSLLLPFFIYYIYTQKRILWIVPFFVFMLPYLFIHTNLGVDFDHYFRSFVMAFCNYIFCVAFLCFVHTKYPLDYLFKNILILNFLLLLLSFVALKIDAIKELFWYLEPISPNIPVIPRLRMFTYEASYYSLQFTPIIFYYILRVLFIDNKSAFTLLLFVLVPIILSFSLGVMMGVVLTLLIILATNPSIIVFSKRVQNIHIIIAVSCIVLLLFLWKFFPDNPLFIRMQNIMEGKDTSARGRTFEAFDLAHKIAQMKSLWFGIGLGQLKLEARNFIIQYYYYTKIPATIRIPNSCAEMLATYGIVGLSIKLLIEVFLFFKQKVYQNYYQLALFIFIFIYQFTGSFIVNVVEYMIWILAFVNVFPVFDKKNLEVLWTKKEI